MEWAIMGKRSKGWSEFRTWASQSRLWRLLNIEDYLLIHYKYNNCCLWQIVVHLSYSSLNTSSSWLSMYFITLCFLYFCVKRWMNKYKSPQIRISKHHPLQFSFQLIYDQLGCYNNGCYMPTSSGVLVHFQKTMTVMYVKSDYCCPARLTRIGHLWPNIRVHTHFDISNFMTFQVFKNPDLQYNHPLLSSVYIRMLMIAGVVNRYRLINLISAGNWSICLSFRHFNLSMSFTRSL